MTIWASEMTERFLSGQINFKRLVEILRQTGYITEENQEAECGFHPASMGAVHQDEFEKLFEHYFPGETCDIVINNICTYMGNPSGEYLYALFNEKVVTAAKMQKILKRQSKKTFEWLKDKS